MGPQNAESPRAPSHKNSPPGALGSLSSLSEMPVSITRCTVRIEDPESVVAVQMKDRFEAAIIEQDPDYVNQIKILRQLGPEKKSKYSEEDGGILLVAYDADDQSVGVAGAAMFGTDVWMGMGYVDPEYRGSGLFPVSYRVVYRAMTPHRELIYARWKWALDRGAVRSVAGYRRNLKAVARMLEKLGYTELQYDGQRWWADYYKVGDGCYESFESRTHVYDPVF